MLLKRFEIETRALDPPIAELSRLENQMPNWQLPSADLAARRKSRFMLVPMPRHDCRLSQPVDSHVCIGHLHRVREGMCVSYNACA